MLAGGVSNLMVVESVGHRGKVIRGLFGGGGGRGGEIAVDVDLWYRIRNQTVRGDSLGRQSGRRDFMKTLPPCVLYSVLGQRPRTGGACGSRGAVAQRQSGRVGPVEHRPAQQVQGREAQAAEAVQADATGHVQTATSLVPLSRRR